MKRLISFVFIGLLATSSMAQDTAEEDVVVLWDTDRSVPFDAITVDLEDFIWLARPVVVFADSPNDPRFRDQMALLAERADELAERDVIILTDTDPSARSELRTRLRPRGFMMVLIGKDGEVELRKPQPWTVRELSRSIDKMPLRQQEIEEDRLSN